MPFSKKQTAARKQAPPTPIRAAARATAPAASPPGADIPEELVAMRAFEKWQLRGSPMGQDSEQDWFAAREELEQERLGWAAPTSEDRDQDHSH